MLLALVWTMCVNIPSLLEGGVWLLGFRCLFCSALCRIGLLQKLIKEVGERILFVMDIHLGGRVCGPDDRECP